MNKPAQANTSPLPITIWQEVIIFLGLDELRSLAETSSFYAGLFHHPQYWVHTSGRLLGGLEFIEVNGASAFEATHAHLKHQTEAKNLLTGCLRASSQDRVGDHPDWSEDPRHTLRPSPCLRRTLFTGHQAFDTQLSHGFQLSCGCSGGRPCYWSSSPSVTGDTDDWILYQMAPPGESLHLLRSFSVTPYTAYWQPRTPTYRSAAVQLQLFLTDAAGAQPYYTSPIFAVESTQEQTFKLSKPAVCVGGVAKLLLLGKAQKQTLDPGSLEHATSYYCCISYVSCLGQKLTTDLKFCPVPAQSAQAAEGRPGTMGRIISC